MWTPAASKARVKPVNCGGLLSLILKSDFEWIFDVSLELIVAHADVLRTVALVPVCIARAQARCTTLQEGIGLSASTPTLRGHSFRIPNKQRPNRSSNLNHCVAVMIEGVNVIAKLDTTFGYWVVATLHLIRAGYKN